MKNFKQILVLALGAMVVFVPTNAVAQSSGVQIWAQRCGMCHQQQPADRYDAERWESIMTHMALTARLTSEQAGAVLDFLKSGARKVAVQEAASARGLTVASLGNAFVPDAADGEEVFVTNCVPCHGKSGKGDGPAAVAFDPPPTDFTDAESVKTQSVEDIVSAITIGNGGMPAFATSLSAEEIEAVAEYILSTFGASEPSAELAE